MKNTTYRFPITMADDCRLADLFHEAERKRVDGACLVSIIWAWRHFR